VSVLWSASIDWTRWIARWQFHNSWAFEVYSTQLRFPIIGVWKVLKARFFWRLIVVVRLGHTLLTRCLGIESSPRINPEFEEVCSHKETKPTKNNNNNNKKQQWYLPTYLRKGMWGENIFDGAVIIGHRAIPSYSRLVKRVSATMPCSDRHRHLEIHFRDFVCLPRKIRSKVVTFEEQGSVVITNTRLPTYLIIEPPAQGVR